MTTQSSNIDLTATCLLVSLHATAYSARRIDRKITRDVHKRHHISEKSGRYNKCLIDIEAPSFVNMMKTRQEGRNYLYKHTSPWTEDGGRILPAASHFEFSKGIGEIIARVKAADQEFFDDWPKLVKQAEIDLNGAFDRSDYPTQGALEAKFNYRLITMPMPSVDDFRVNLSKGTVAAIKQQAKEDCERAYQNAMRSVWDRLFDPVKNMAVQFSKPNGKVFDSHITNIIEVCNMLPNLNIANDQRLEEFRQEALKNLTRPAAVVRANPDAKAELATKAKAIADKMAALMGA